MIATVVQHLPCFKDLIAVLFECFLIITLGYLSCRFKLISTQAKDLNSYLTTFALPMIIFLNIAQMNFQTINVSFLLCMLTSKLLVFILVTIITLAISYPTNFGYAGALSILATQSNDFALGYPLIKSLYGDTRSEMLDYLNLMAPIQLLILNPLGIVMLEYQKSRKVKKLLSKECNRNMLKGSHEDQESIQDEINDDNDDEDNDEDRNHVDHGQQKRGRDNNSSHICKCTKRTNFDKSSQLQDFRQTQISNVDSILDEICSDNHHSNSDIVDENKLKQQIRRRMSANDKADECLQTINEKVTKKHTNIPKVASKNVKSLKLMIPGLTDNIRNRGDSDSFTHSIAKSQPTQSNQETTTTTPPSLLACCYCTNKGASSSGVVGSKLRTDYIITTSTSAISSVTSRNGACNRVIEPKASDNSSPPSIGKKFNPSTTTMLNLNFIKALATNPLIIASVVALAVNLIHGPQLPKFVTKVSNTIAASFAAPALFVVGLSMFGKFELILKNPNDLLLSSVLVMTKVILLPSLMRTLALIILPAHTPAEEIPYLIDFSFLYGLLPTAPTACIIAKQYGVLTNVVSISMLLSIFLSAPLMLAASVIINPASVIKLADIQDVITQTLEISGLITFLLASVALYAFWRSMKRSKYNKFINLPLEVACRQVTSKIKTNPTYIFLFLLAITQIVIGLGGMSWFLVAKIKVDPNKPAQYLRNIQSDNIALQLSKNSTTQSIQNTNFLNISKNDIVVETEQPILIELPSPIPADSNVKQSTIYEEGPAQVSNKDIPSSWLESISESSERIENNHNHSASIFGQQFDLSSETWSIIQYVLSSFGLLLARLVILCILITTASLRFGGHLIATKVSSILIKSILSISLVLIILLIYETNQKGDDIFPVESIIPTKKCSLYIRLVYNSICIILSVPLFVLVIRADNKTMKLLNEKISASTRQNNDDESIEEADEEAIVVGDRRISDHFGPRKRRKFASNVSLSSDTSSALTANTNLESTPCSNIPINDVNNSNNNHDSSNCSEQNQSTPPPLIQSVDSVSVLIESGSTNNDNNNTKRVLTSILNDQNNDKDLIEVDCNRFDESNYNTLTLIQRQQLENERKGTKQAIGLIQMSEFNKYSILILFMLITTTLNITSIVQKLVQDKPFGTFRQIEIMSIALEFGQGLLTFLIYGFKGASNQLFV